MHHRRSIRLADYDYSQAGAYFVTICTHQRYDLFGAVEEGVMRLNSWGQIVQEEWHQTAVLRPHVDLDAFVIMPNHIHGIMVITDDGRGMMHHAPTGLNSDLHHAPTGLNSDLHHAPTGLNSGLHHAPTQRKFAKPISNSLSSIVGTFKAAVTRRINRSPEAPDHPIWQQNYYEHIVRSETSLNEIRGYIINNPSRWAADSLYTG